mmetsp:Transcript_7494/g.15564  ORF Transcript_7494/g.15564 Transcript_7494/m.15564 type:complete len:92 (+) Transcript_7494:920-1195(+)
MTSWLGSPSRSSVAAIPVTVLVPVPVIAEDAEESIEERFEESSVAGNRLRLGLEGKPGKPDAFGVPGWLEVGDKFRDCCPFGEHLAELLPQ